ncbi:hypothetical protein [Caballeronia sp. LZ034LL]|uniref:hypothetical protein n=1 Tax=Caballeronia sp. LZ034LL TaxID=3038567 RepID=UPI002856D063|nr:hypothetical protein [Caballeronia sp. LZ034LL]MDR5836427.1 hypothetical protein [Caballeronia sp. LZ034LL]
MRRNRRAEPPAGADAFTATQVTGPSSIEYRESHRGYLLRVSANHAGRYVLIVEDPVGGEPCPLRDLHELDGRLPHDGFADLAAAIAAVPAAKDAIDDGLRRRKAA